MRKRHSRGRHVRPPAGKAKPATRADVIYQMLLLATGFVRLVGAIMFLVGGIPWNL